MVNVIGVRFQNAGKLYFFDPGTFWPTPGDFVLVETSRGIEFGEVVTQVKEIDDSTLSSPLKQVVRIASEEDVKHAQENKAAEKEAYAICQKKIAEHKLDMKLVSVEYTFDNSKILFYFTANGRVDFRSLVKDLAGVFKTRIELRQIGVRDEAKMLGGLGPCGRPICCGAFLGDFQPVSIKMAKEQNLSLNPNKISGVCGRLMCCLKYEQDQYEQTRKKMPKVGKEVMTPDGPGVVWDLNIIKETVRVRIQKGDSSELKDYPMDDVQRAGAQPVQHQQPKEDPAEDLAADEENLVDVPAVEAPEEDVVPQSRPRRERGERQPKSDAQKPRREEGEKPARSDRREKSRDDRRREDRRVRQEAPVAEAPAEKPVEEVLTAAEKPAEAPAAPVESKPEVPAVSPWKAALERAMREAEGK
ncbi:MAG: stage 0 sporulation family protein [Clostridia bacterium]|nr:stage 0 sporulation family protein [Clostridia bacterium]